MKPTKLFISAALACGLLSVSALAYVEQPTPWPQAPRADVPVVVKAVSPLAVRQIYEGSTIMVAFTVDPSGQPKHIRIVNNDDPLLSRSLIPTLEQWRFAPVQKNGVAVSTRVLLPIKLIDGA